MGITYRKLPKRDGTLIAIPSMPSSSGPDPEPFDAACCGRQIIPEPITTLGGALTLWQWRYCDCMTEALDVAEEERLRRDAEEKQRQQWRLRQAALDALCPQWHESSKVPRQTFGTFVADDVNRAVVNRVKHWMSAVPPEGFLLVGPVGTGKSHLVRAVSHELRAQYRTVMYTTVPFLLERLRGPAAVEMTAVLKAMTSADVVIWDDLGAEKPTEWALDRLYLLLDARYETETPLIATSNWTPSGLEARLGPRLVSRLLEMGPVWEVPGSDYRVRLAERRLMAVQ